MPTLKIILTLTACLLWACLPAGAQTLRQLMDRLHRERQINFVYDASLPVDRTYEGPALEGLSTRRALRLLFRGSGIGWKMHGRHVALTALKGKAAATTGSHTLSGTVRGQGGEPLVNATVYDLTSATGTTTNAHGFFSLTLPDGPHRLRYSCTGHTPKTEDVDVRGNRQMDVRLDAGERLPEVVVRADLNSPLLTTQTGRRSLTQDDIKTEYALLSSPDLLKTLQRSSGVAEGMELMSGLMVHGGGGDENLMLLDGTPLYDINHMAGLFSSFNPDVIKNVDFYKSGFPARYGGRLSSVVDVRTKDGDTEHTHGSVRVGMLDAAVQLEGPLKKGRTSYNIGLRRSYSDLILALIPWSDSNDDVNISYYFMDLNAKVTHHLNPRSKLALSLYSGNDHYHTKDNWQQEYDGLWRKETTRYRMNWGNINAALEWDRQFSPRLFGSLTAVYTRNRSMLHGYDDEREGTEEEGEGNVYHMEHSYDNAINDVGYRAAFDLRPAPRHHIRMGHDYTCHLFRPQTLRLHNFQGNAGESIDTVSTASGNRQAGHELTAYAEDEMTLTDRWSANLGLHASLFVTQGKAFAYVDPRLAVKYRVSEQVSLKASFTRMSQYMHKLQNTYLSLPTDYWVPTTRRLRPMYAWQAAAGVYCQPGRHWTLTAEGYYKWSRHLLQYESWVGLEPPADRWDQMVADGRGLSYGMEADAAYRARRLQLKASYTLSWNKRLFRGFYPDWFSDKYDNRHKLSLSLRCRMSRKASVYAAWGYHTGYHTTVPTQVAALPDLPAPGGQHLPGSTGWQVAYTRPNNVKLPDYHRLDVGFDFRHTGRRRHREHIWNLSAFNVYCHKNPLYITVEYDYEKQCYRARSTSIIPVVVPSFSYTMKF